MKHPPSPQAFGPAISRIADVAAHTNRYAFRGVPRLAEDIGVDRTIVHRIFSGRLTPSQFVLNRITEAFERDLGYKLDPRDLLAEAGRFPTRYACDLIGSCRGCLPEIALDEFGDTKKVYEGIKPGQWVTSRYPRGYELTDNEGGTNAD